MSQKGEGKVNRLIIISPQWIRFEVCERILTFVRQLHNYMYFLIIANIVTFANHNSY